MGVPDLDVTSLRIVRALADHGTITAAAAVLGYSQPAVSQHLRRLERRLGTALLERAGRTVRLTEAGQVLARHGATVTAALDAAVQEVGALTGLRAGRVRLVAFPSASATIVPGALALLRTAHPELAVTLDEAEPPESVERLRSGGCDVVIAFTHRDGTGQPAAPGPQGHGAHQDGQDRQGVSPLVRRPLLDDATVLALPAGSPLVAHGRLQLADLVGQTWIAGCPRCRGHLLRACERAGFTPRIAYATDDYSAVLGLVAAGLGVALLPGLVTPAAARHPGVAVRAIGGTARRDVHALTTPDLARVPAVAATLRALERAAARLDPA